MKATLRMDSCMGKGNITMPGDCFILHFDFSKSHVCMYVCSGAEYVGDFWYGLMHGLGSLRHSSGDFYEGKLVIRF